MSAAQRNEEAASTTKAAVPDDPRAHVAARYAAARTADRPEAWITLRPESDVAAEYEAVAVRAAAGEDLPLAGFLFSVKGNIDVAGLDTTAGCPAFAYQPDQDATVVARLRRAGAVVLGTTNLDQFATGLVGTRSPFGAVRHATDPTRVSGGSSSGSAVTVALGIADFALGTDTAGSGRVPAAFHGLYGLKPTKGWVSAAGVVPACRSQDVVTVMAKELSLARNALQIMAGPDERDPLSRPTPGASPTPERPRIGVAPIDQLGELAPGWAEAYSAYAARIERAGAALVEVDITSFLDVARMLYDGAFVAERYTAVGRFIDANPTEIDPTVRAIIQGARSIPAWRLYEDFERLDRHRVESRAAFERMDALLLPTTVQHPTLEAVAADPLGVNSTLGRFTNFANLLDLAAIAIPAGEVDDLPFGVQLVGPAFSDATLASFAERWIA